jgi:hypothetical protein
MGGGDLFSVAITDSATVFYLSFDYLYINQPFGGGFIGIDAPGELWLAGDCDGWFPTSNAMNGLPAGQ